MKPEGVALFDMIFRASIPVQLVLALLIAASVISWTMIFRKYFAYRAALREAERFEKRFWSGTNLNQMFTEFTKNDEEATSGMSTMFVEGFREFKRLTQQSHVKSNEILEGVQRAMRVALSRETDFLETHLSFLATVGSTSPYVGLFGTVWGIMHSFMSLSSAQAVTIADVAPGIAE